jgi:hypothetical protein
VLDHAQEAVGVGELGGVGAPDEPGGGEPVERDQRGAGAQLRVEASVDELEQLHRELDVAGRPVRA